MSIFRTPSFPLLRGAYAILPLTVSLLLVSCGGSSDAPPPPLEVPQHNAQAPVPQQQPLPAQGLKTDLLFAEKITDPEARFARIEYILTDMYQDIQDMKDSLQETQMSTAPVILTMPDDTIIDTSMPADLISIPDANSQPTVLMPEESAKEDKPADIAGTEEAEPEEKKDPPKPAVKPETSNNEKADKSDTEAKASGNGVQSVRIAEQPDQQTRIVLDLKNKANYTHDLDNDEHLLIVELPETSWSTSKSANLRAPSLVESWSAQPMEDGKGSRMIIKLRRDAKVASKEMLKNPDRIVIDLQGS